MSINNKLVKFATQDLVLARTAVERARITKSLDFLETSLRKHFDNRIDEVLKFGSYTRNTILPRKYDTRSDVDLMVVFNTDNGVYNPETYRKWLSDFLKIRYPNSLSKKDLPSVKLELNHIMFDLVPSYVSSGFFTEHSHYIPKSDTTWMKTVPNDLNQDLQSLNQRIGNNSLRNAIRLCKHFNARANYPFSSYEFEKKILSYCDWNSFNNENTFQLFFMIMNSLAGNIPEVKLALKHIKKYDGDFFTEKDEVKQLLWLGRLLPGVK